MRVERLAALAIVIMVASAGFAGAVESGNDIRASLAQATQPGNGPLPATQPTAPAAQPAPAAAPAVKPPPAHVEPRPQPRRARAPAPKRDPRIDSQECTWVGKRTIRVLMRDDLIAADGFLKFYNAFGCPVRYLGQAFGCSLIGTSNAPAKDVEDRVDACWKNPAVKAAAAAAPPAAPASKPAAPAPKPMPKAVTPAPKPAPPPAKPEPETAYPKR